MEDVKADTSGNKLTVIGKVDPTKLRDKLAEKTKKEVEIVSPQNKKDVTGDKLPEKKKHEEEEKKPDDEKSEQKSPKQVSNFLTFFNTVDSS